MPFTRFVEIGRLCVVSFGPLADKLAVVADIIDDKRVLVDIVNTNEARQVMPVKRLKLTEFCVKFERAAAPAVVAEAVKAEGVIEKFNESTWGKKMAAMKAKTQLNDFQRFKYAKLSAKRDEIMKAELAKH